MPSGRLTKVEFPIRLTVDPSEPNVVSPMRLYERPLLQVVNPPMVVHEVCAFAAAGIARRATTRERRSDVIGCTSLKIQAGSPGKPTA